MVDQWLDGDKFMSAWQLTQIDTAKSLSYRT